MKQDPGITSEDHKIQRTDQISRKTVQLGTDNIHDDEQRPRSEKQDQPVIPVDFRE